VQSEPLGIGDRKFLINRLIQQAPIHTLVREFFKNAEENAHLAPEGQRRIEIYPTEIDGTRKLTFWNTGVGMDELELRTATDLSSSVNKSMSLDGNFGIGAKVSGLAASPEGIRYRSCKNGRVHEVVIGYDEEQSTYVRFAAQLPDGTSDVVYDVTGVSQEEEHSLDHDWTEVVLLGQGPGHDTVAEPIGQGVPVERSFIATSIYRRFVDFLPGVRVLVDVAMTKGGGKGETGRFRQLKTLNDVLDRLGQSELVSHESGVSVTYVHDPRYEASSHSTSARANPATGSTTFCALIYKSERYDFKTQKSWSSVAPTFGIPFGSKVLTIEIEIPEYAVMPSQYRDKLLWRTDRSDVTADQFAHIVRELMPDWVKEVIRQESPDGADDLSDLQADLQKLLDELRVPTLVSKPSRAGLPARLSNEGTPDSETTPIESEDEEQVRTGEDIAERRTEVRATKSRVRLAPQGAVASKLSRGLERAPEIKILNDPDEVAEKGMKGRAGKFYKDSQTLFINGLYPAAEKMAAELADDFDGVDEPEEARDIALKASRRTLALRVGKATCFALAKKNVDDWSPEDLDRATSPESLSLAADDFRQSIPQAKRWMREQARIDAAMVMA